MTPPPADETINGTERIGWDQSATDAIELAQIGYVIYVDGVRTPLADVSCAPAAAEAMFTCSARLPALSAGKHSLQLASFVNDGGVRESERSGTLVVTVVPSVTGANPAPGFEPSTIVTTDGVAMRVERVAAGFDRPTDLSFAPDGRLFVAEQRGTIRIVTRAAASGSGAVPNAALSIPDATAASTTLLAVAIDPQFERTRFVFTVSVAPSRSGGPAFTLARFREASHTLADRAVLLDDVRAAASDPRAAIRFGPDGKLYVALDDGGDPQRRGDRASSNGKILRLNPDGTTPDDQAGASPLYAEGFGSPGGFDWHPRSGALWLADRERGGAGLREVTQDPSARGRDRRGVVRDSYALSPALPSSIAFYRGGVFPALANTLLVASGEAQVLRVTDGKQRPPLQVPVGGVRAVAVSPDGAVYFATADAVGRLVPDGR
jgi:glucose/arabinose dehydrogenase